MTALFLPWSHSRLKTYLACPKQLYHTQVAERGRPERIEFVQTQAMKDGNEIDEALTARISGAPLPPKFAQWEGVAQVVLDAPGIKFTQMKLALDQAFTPCGYTDWDKAWVRVIYDIAVIDGDRGFLGDWKNGMIWPDEAQLRLFAAVGFHQFPEVETFHTSYIWLKHGSTSDNTYHRTELPDLWQTFLPDVERMQVSYQADHWPATPSKQACKWCAVNRVGACSVAAVRFGG
ncbi:MAG: hypothetical protein DDT20_00932 [Firmicutes bacterium]|nr:hypothetical protein [Bacillota bacterium]